VVVAVTAAVLEVLVLAIKVLLVVMAHSLNLVAVVVLEPLVLPQYQIQAMALGAQEPHHQLQDHRSQGLAVGAVLVLVVVLVVLVAAVLVGLQQELMEPSILVVVEAVVQQLQAQAAPALSYLKPVKNTLRPSLAV
jgi:hypothetical protein